MVPGQDSPSCEARQAAHRATARCRRRLLLVAAMHSSDPLWSQVHFCSQPATKLLSTPHALNLFSARSHLEQRSLYIYERSRATTMNSTEPPSDSPFGDAPGVVHLEKLKRVSGNLFCSCFSSSSCRCSPTKSSWVSENLDLERTCLELVCRQDNAVHAQTMGSDGAFSCWLEESS